MRLPGIARPPSPSFSERGGEPSQVEGVYVTAAFFDVLGVAPAAGRVFSGVRDRVAGEKLVVLGDALWQQLFDRRPDAVGARIRLDGEPYRWLGC